MKGGWAALLVALALAGGAPLGAEPAAVRVPALSGPAPLARCAGRLATGIRGLAAIRAVCPDIDRSVASLGLGAVLPPEWQTRLDATALRDLSALETRYAGQPLSHADAAQLRSIASHMDGETGPTSWWQRLVAWLARTLAPSRGQEPSWARTLPAWMLHPRVWWWVRQVMLGAVVIGLAVLVLRELHAAGRLGGAAERRKAPLRPTRGPHAPSSDLDTEEPRVPDGEHRPALLLRTLIEALRRSRRIDHDRHLTWREITRRARFDSPLQRNGFTRLALLAEQELYGPPGCVAQVPDELRDSVAALREQLLTAPPASIASP